MGRMIMHSPALRSPSASAAIRTSGSSRLTLLARPPAGSGLKGPLVPLLKLSRSIFVGEPPDCALFPV